MHLITVIDKDTKEVTRITFGILENTHRMIDYLIELGHGVHVKLIYKNLKLGREEQERVHSFIIGCSLEKLKQKRQKELAQHNEYRKKFGP